MTLWEKKQQKQNVERKTNENEVCLGALFGALALENDREKPWKPNQGVKTLFWELSGNTLMKKYKFITKTKTKTHQVEDSTTE